MGERSCENELEELEVRPQCQGETDPRGDASKGQDKEDSQQRTLNVTKGGREHPDGHCPSKDIRTGQAGTHTCLVLCV